MDSKKQRHLIELFRGDNGRAKALATVVNLQLSHVTTDSPGVLPSMAPSLYLRYFRIVYKLYHIHHGYIMFTHVSGRTHSQHTNQCIDLAIEPTIDHIHLFKPDFWPWTHLRTLRAIRALHAIRVHPSESIPANPSLQVPILAISHTNGVIRGTLDACCKFASQFVSHIPTFPSGTPYLQGLFSCRLHCNSTTVSWPFFSPT